MNIQKIFFKHNCYIFVLIVGVVFLSNAKYSFAAAPGGDVCGNEICEASEDAQNCFIDCNPCGDDVCDANIGENVVTCSADCDGSMCGDGTCDAGEDFVNCSNDCEAPVPGPQPGEPSPSCEDVVIHVGEETTCSIKVENVETFPLTEVTAEVQIPNKVTKISNTDSWNCTSMADGTKCQKTYSPYLLMNEIEYLELTLTTNIEGEYGLVAQISGKGETQDDIVYTGTKNIMAREAATATANADYFFSSGTVNNRSLANNDTLCSFGTTTFEYYNVQAGTNVTAFDENTGIVSFTTSECSGGVLFFYRIKCDGVDTSTSQVYNTCA